MSACCKDFLILRLCILDGYPLVFTLYARFALCGLWAGGLWAVGVWVVCGRVDGLWIGGWLVDGSFVG